MKYFPLPVTRAIVRARSLALTGEPLLDHAWDLFVDVDPSFFNLFLSWVADNVALTVSAVTYPDRGVLVSVLCTIFSCLVCDRFGDAELALECFKDMLSVLQPGPVAVSPQKNLFHLHDLVADLLDFQIDSSSDDVSSPVLHSCSAPSDCVVLSAWLAEEQSVLTSDSVYMSHVVVAQRWKFMLDKVLNCENDIAFAAVKSDLAGVIREMKKITKRTYSLPQFRRAIKDCGLASVFESLCNPSFVLSNRNVHLLQIERLYRLGDQLSEILDSWTPPSISATWTKQSSPFVARQDLQDRILSPKHFIEIFDDTPANVPGEDNLSYCFFLTTFESFAYNFERWMGRFLENKGYNVTEFTNVRVLRNFYSQLIWLVRHWCNDIQYTRDGDPFKTIDLKVFTSPRWRLILKKTAWLRQLSNESDARAKSLIHCTKCLSLPASHRCCRYICMPHITSHVTDDTAAAAIMATLREELRGAGVTLVPPNAQIKHSASSGVDDPHCLQHSSLMYHPDAVGKTHPIKLHGLEPDPVVLARCGHQLLLVLDQIHPSASSESSGIDWASVRDMNVVDFAWWRPLTSNLLSIVQDNVVESTGVQPVKRGAQFQSFAGGKMVPLGSRLPSGGRPGDAYTSYSGLDASSVSGLDILFNQAATSVILHSFAKHVHPDLARDLRKVSTDCDRIGSIGANIFNCTGYMAPLHSDQDATSGLCFQALLHADPAYKEFSFCNVEYRYYITTSTNCLWSFNSSNLHGTMLPSLSTVQNLNSHALDPNRVVASAGCSPLVDSLSAGPSSAGPSSAGPSSAGPSSADPSLPASARPYHLRPRRQVVAAVPARNRVRASENARRRRQFEERSDAWRRR
ncbi:hypothetical protein F5880DRAFT_1504509 [Lentinula raphanica]|nr:hypothetical protein F5880DRAFT_1504509 [Lentinula raphanica]